MTGKQWACRVEADWPEEGEQEDDWTSDVSDELYSVRSGSDVKLRLATKYQTADKCVSSYRPHWTDHVTWATPEIQMYQIQCFQLIFAIGSLLVTLLPECSNTNMLHKGNIWL